MLFRKDQSPVTGKDDGPTNTSLWWIPFMFCISDAVWDSGRNARARCGAVWKCHKADHGERTASHGEFLVPQHAGLGHFPRLHERAGVCDPGVRVLPTKADLLKLAPSWTGAPREQARWAYGTHQLPSKISNSDFTVAGSTKKSRLRIIFSFT